MSDAPEFCHYCGAKMEEYPITLRKGIVRGLVKWYKKHGLEYGAKTEVPLQGGEISNWAHLRYWGLIEALPGNARGGIWRVTPKGLDFITGRIALRKKVWTWRNKVQREEGKLTRIQDVTDGWKYRPDYARESEHHRPDPDQPRLL